MNRSTLLPDVAAETVSGDTPLPRTQRTQAHLRQALESLIVEQDYDSITIQQILDRAHVSRSAFYMHFSGKDELFRSGFSEMRHTLEQCEPRAGQPAVPLRFTLPLFEHAHRYRDIHRALFGRRAGAVLDSELRTLFSELVRKDLSHCLPQTSQATTAFEMSIQHVVGALLAVLTWWFNASAKIRQQPGEVHALFLKLAVPGIRHTLSSDSANHATARGRSRARHAADAERL